LIYLWIALGSGLGGVGRYALQGFAARLFGATFPWGTLIVNTIGSAFIGWFAGMTSPDGRWLLSTTARQFVMVGICGGFTTFSSFSLETLNLAKAGEPWRAAGYVIASMAACLVGVWLGWARATEMSR
jgi:CrcB protein